MGALHPGIRSRRMGLGALGPGAFLVLGAMSAGLAWAGEKTSTPDPVTRGRALFFRTWEVEDRRAPAGDGLGPLFNERSCVACHNLGGVGGAGPASKNVDIVTILFHPVERQDADHAGRRRPKPEKAPDLDSSDFCAVCMCLRGRPKTEQAPEPQRPDLAEMIAIHAGFAASRSIVLHRFGVSPGYENWRRHLMESDLPATNSGTRPELQPDPDLTPTDRPATLPETAQRGSFTLLRSERNSTALFGDGLIDSIPDAAIEAHANPLPPPSPSPSALFQPRPAVDRAVHGRVSRLKDGRIGRFGWKAQMASLEEFVLTACSVEVGLEVPGHSQGEDPLGYGYRGPGLDLTKSECDDLVAYVRSLPAPVERKPSNGLGKDVFEAIGCAACHLPKLGDVEGIYSDLLLHDMGDELEDTSSGYMSPGLRSPGEEIPEPGTLADSGSDEGRDSAQPTLGAGRREWRTPPLWGVRDSAPYLHDGRAPTLEKAIALHRGDARRAAGRFETLPPMQRDQLLQFLRSLAAPRPVAHKGPNRP